MRSPRHLLVVSTVGLTLIAPSATAAGVRAPALDSRAPTAIELALAEHSCGPQTSATSADARYQCISDRVDSLRADFGYNLGRLTASRRQAIERACGRLRGAVTREAYVACVSGELVSPRSRKAAPESAPESAAAPEAVATPVDSPHPPPKSTWVAWLIGFLGAGIVAAAGAVMAMRVKAARHGCRSCGAKVPPTGDLCPDCRKQAAEALRQAAAERADRERAQQDEKRRQEQDAEQQRARDEVEAQVRREHEERSHRQREEEDARLREEETRRNEAAHQGQRGPATAGEEAFDPYAILGVSRDAGRDAVVAAYEQARSKYDPTSVAHLGDEAQSFYKAKAEAVERAYQMLVG